MSETETKQEINLTGKPAPYAPNRFDSEGRKTGQWAEYLDDSDTLNNRLHEAMEPGGIKEPMNGEGFYDAGFSYTYEKGLYEAGKRVGRWGKYSLKRVIEEYYNYDTDGEMTGQYVTFTCNCHEAPTPLSAGNYIKGIKNGAEYSLRNLHEDNWACYGVSDDAPFVPVTVGTEVFESKYVINYENGKLVSEGPVGAVEETAPDPETGGQFVDGKKNGRWSDDTGEGEYVAGVKEGKWYCTVTNIFSDNNLMFWASPEKGADEEKTFVTFSKGVLHGSYQQKNGVGEYVDGKREGLWTHVDRGVVGSNKETDLTGTYVNGLREGVWTNGTVTVTYAGGVMDGYAKLFRHSDSKKISDEGNYLKGKKEGEWSHFSDTGELEEKGTYSEDVKVGPWTYWYMRDGITGEFTKYSSWQKDKTFETSKPTGVWSTSSGYKFTCSDTVNFHKDKYDIAGIIHTIFFGTKTVADLKPVTLGTEVKCEKDSDGKFHGKYTRYDSKGHVETSGEYNHGVPVGKWRHDTFNSYCTGEYDANETRTGFWEFFVTKKHKSVPEKSGEYKKGVFVGVWNCTQLGVDIDFNSKL